MAVLLMSRPHDKTSRGEMFRYGSSMFCVTDPVGG